MAIYRGISSKLDQRFLALADPTRRAILARLSRGDASVSELNQPFDLAQPTISKHLKVLEQAGFIERSRDAQRRPRKLVPAAFKELAEWMDQFCAQWEARFSNLDAQLASMNRKEKKNAP